MGIYDPLLYGIVGPMYSGKTEELLRRLKRYKIAKVPVQAFRYAKDNRYSEEGIASFDGNMFPADSILTTKDIEDVLDPKAKVYAFDEVQFLDDRIIELLDSLAKKKSVIYTALNLDFRGDPFHLQLYPPDPELKRFSDRTIGELLAISNDVMYLTAICKFGGDDNPCGKLALRSQRLIEGDPAPYDAPLILIGSEEAYEARCIEHHVIPGKPEYVIKQFW